MIVIDHSKLQEVIAAYKKYFPTHIGDEIYKWKAVKQFQDVWDIDDPDFRSMFLNATSLHKNLLDSAYHYARACMQQMCEIEPETVRSMFRVLYDEQIELSERIHHFTSEADRIRKDHFEEQWHHSQDLNTISTYLWSRFPDNYFIYKYKEVKVVAKVLDSNCVIRKGSSAPGYIECLEFFNILRDAIKKDPDIRPMLNSVLTSDCYRDDNLSCVVVDFVFYVSRFFSDEQKASTNSDKETDIDPMIKEYINILESNHNMILTGAPGTGKTHLARQIAKAMGDNNPGFVQFHPSYDYTDFVEGLRPTDEGSFERVNGVFKQFCADSLSNIRSNDFDKAYDSLLSDLSEMDKPLELSTPKGGANYGISLNKQGNLNLHTGSGLIRQGVLTKEMIRKASNEAPVYQFWKGYYQGVVNLLKNKYGLIGHSSVDQASNRVFIIDEINRGELSKIFGELFYAIDPGYRGEKGCIKTQYQNMVALGDPFEKGFYVPTNVFIIGTMNDIDRGVESMDFAIRRRFAWVEVQVDDCIEMLDEQVPDWSDAAKRCMESLNSALKEVIGLTSAYDIGPAYFLKLKHYKGDFEKLWDYHIKGIVTEYLRGTKGIEKKVASLKEAFDAYKD